MYPILLWFCLVFGAWGNLPRDVSSRNNTAISAQNGSAGALFGACFAPRDIASLRAQFSLGYRGGAPAQPIESEHVRSSGFTGPYGEFIDDFHVNKFREQLPPASMAAKSGGNVIYRLLNAAAGVNYVAITGNLECRAAKQLTQKGINIEPIFVLQNLSRADARAVKRVLIETYGLSGDGGTLLNKSNSISPNNPIYQQSIQRGSELLRQAGYQGF